MAVLFTSDPHYGHARVIPNCRRPFQDVGEMDAAMIARWNAAVGPDDDAWILGDFSAYRDGRLEAVFWRLQGRKRLIVGNHDEENQAVLDLPWEDPPEKHLLVHVDGDPVFLCHYPMASWPKIGKGAVHLFGHMHGAMKGDRLALDVGVDVWDFAPVGMDAIRRRLRTLPERRDVVLPGGRSPVA